MVRHDYGPGEGPIRGIVHGCLPALFCAVVIVGIIAAAIWAVNR